MSKLSFLLLLSLGTMICTSPVRLMPWGLTDGNLQQVGWQNAAPASNILKFPDMVLNEENRSVTLTSSEGSWTSPRSWQVRQAAWTDLNHDGIPEATILVFRPFEPWPVDRLLPNGGRINAHQDEAGMSSHIILVGWKKDHWGEVWAGSALARPVLKFETSDLDEDGKQELIVLEGIYQTYNPNRAISFAVWEWNGFGFDLVSRAETGVSNLSILETNQNQKIILVD
jgi:hypothetical protein